MRSEDLALARSAYADLWEAVNSAHFLAAGLYTWMAGFVEGKRRVLEIGVGAGTSTETLLRRGHQVIGVDNNPECVVRASTALEHSGFRTALQCRGFAHVDPTGYRMDYAPVSLNTSDVDVALIEGSVAGDADLVYWLQCEEPFDAVTCWLLGSHKEARKNHDLPEDIRNGNGLLYRVHLQQLTYRLAEKVLLVDGILSIIDRGDAPADRDAAERAILDVHRGQARGTGLDPERIEWRHYCEPFFERGEGVEMKRIGRGTEAPRPVMFSVVSRKRMRT